MRCYECPAESDLQVVEVIDISEEGDGNESDLSFCLPCLKRLSLYCEEHATPKFCMHDLSTYKAAPGHFKLMSACVRCCRRDTETLPEEAVQAYQEHLLTDDGHHQAFLDGLISLADSLLEEPLPDELKSPFAVILMTTLFGDPLDDVAIKPAMIQPSDDEVTTH